MVDAGTSGAVNFDDFRDHVIKKSKTRVLAFVNISKRGMTDFGNEDKPEELDTAAAVKVAKAKVVASVANAAIAETVATVAESAVVVAVVANAVRRATGIDLENNAALMRAGSRR